MEGDTVPKQLKDTNLYEGLIPKLPEDSNVTPTWVL